MTYFFCSECVSETTKWSGRCPVCGAWNSLQESDRIVGRKKSKRKTSSLYKQRTQSDPIPRKVSAIKLSHKTRLQTGIRELDNTLGGGITPGMVILVGGEPGIGKSTLMMQAGSKISSQGKTVLYISGEESDQQIKMRADRIQCANDNLLLVISNSLTEILEAIIKTKPDLTIIDSIQSIYSDESDSLPGSVNQLKECSAAFVTVAKSSQIPFILIGHVTKEGIVAGPKILEHIVDTVLYFEKSGNDQLRLIRTTKNRFGPTNEIGVFEMTGSGLMEIGDPSHIFLKEFIADPGISIGCMLEGSRPFLVEVQALVSPASYGTPQRVSLGFDQRKLSLILAVLEKQLALNLRMSDVFLNLAEGMKVLEPSLDLAVAAAIISSYKEKILPEKALFLGEIGLNGEIRTVSGLNKRLKETGKLGYVNVFMSGSRKVKSENLNFKYLKNIRDLYKSLIK